MVEGAAPACREMSALTLAQPYYVHPASQQASCSCSLQLLVHCIWVQQLSRRALFSAAPEHPGQHSACRSLSAIQTR